jgi:hypothetical protein
VSWLKRRNRQIDTGKLPEWMKEEVQNTPLSELGFWVSVKKLVLVKQENGVIKDRQIVLYFYIKDRSIAPRYGMLRATAEAPLSGNYDAPLQSIKDLMGDAIPLMFEPVQSERIYLSIVADRGAAGYAIIFMLFLIPLAVIAFPVWRNAVEKGTVRPISFRNNKE